MELSIVRDGKRFPYSYAMLRADNPSVSFPRDLSGVDLTPFGVIAEPTVFDEPTKPHAPEQRMVAMHAFLWGLRELGLRVQFERYMLSLEGHARDFWMTAPYVSRSSTYVAHMRSFFGLSDLDFGQVWRSAESIEE